MHVRPKFGKWNEKNCHLSPYSALCNLPIVAVTLTSLYSDSVFLYLEHFLTLYGIVMDRSY